MARDVLAFVVVWLVGWPRYKLGACPVCQSDDFHPTCTPDSCEVCQGARDMTPAVWRRYREAMRASACC